ncbi:MAG: type IV pili methyl-accepting chemotaxis transducer N-terminal domain-containing protein, partial [Betaproteobacteria bacterium]
MPKLFGADAPAAENIEFDPPTTQVRMVASATEPYDPLASMSIMDQLRVAANAAPVPPKLPIIGNLPIVRQFQVLGLLALLFVALAVFMFYLDDRATSQQALRASTATEMQMLSQRLARGSALAAQGQANAFAAVRDSRERFKRDLDALVSGGTLKGTVLDATQNPAALETLKSLQARWLRVDAAATQLVDNERSLTSLANGLGAISRGNSGLLELAQKAAQQIGQSGGSTREADYANQLAMLSQRIAKNASMLASADEIDPEMAVQLGKDATTFRDVLNGLSSGSDALKLNAPRSDDARATLAELGKRFGAYEAGVNAIQASMKNLVVAKQAARSINSEAEPLLTDATQLADAYQSGGRPRVLSLGLGVLFALVALGSLALIAKAFLDDVRARAQESEHENKRNQEAILRLLNEMGNLADGDLTVQASVTEDVTGAIADSINFTIEELRTLVRGINSATDQVTKATQET